MPVQVYARSAVLALAAAILGAMRSARAAARLAPALAMAPPAPPRFRRRAIDRALARLRVPQPTMMILRSLVRWPLRAALTAPGLALAVAVLVASGFFGDAFAAILDSAFDQSNRQDATLIFADDRPRVAPEEVRRLPGVVQAEPQLLIPAILRHGPAEKRVAIEGRQPGADPGRVGDAEGRVVTPAPDALHLSQRLAGALDVAPGDRLRVEVLGGRRERVELPVAGVVPLFIGLGAYTEIDSLDALQRRAPRLPVVNVALDHRQGQAFHAPLEEIPRLSAAVFTTENRRAFEQTIAQNIAVSATVYVALGVMITFGMACNAARIQLSERARELASLRILGFTRAEVGYVLTGETLLLALLAQPLGRGIGAGVARLFTERFSSDL